MTRTPSTTSATDHSKSTRTDDELSDRPEQVQPEVWRPITHLGEYAAARYEVSTLGRVRSNDHHAGTRLYRGLILKPQKASTAAHVALYVGPGVKRTCKIHALVLSTFIGLRPAGREGCHNDGDPWNNVLSNLRWDTHSNNQKDMARHGRHWLARKKRCPRKHLLKMPNLVRNKLDNEGYRYCLSCKQTNKLNLRLIAKGKPTLDLQIESDRRYALIMANEAVR